MYQDIIEASTYSAHPIRRTQNKTNYADNLSGYTHRSLLGNPVYYIAPQALRGPAAGSDYGWIVVMNGDIMVVGADTAEDQVGLVTISSCAGTLCTLRSTIKNPIIFPGFFGQGLASIKDCAAIGAPEQHDTGSVYIYNIKSLSSPILSLTIDAPESTVRQRFGTALALFPYDGIDLALVVGDSLGTQVYVYKIQYLNNAGASTLLTVIKCPDAYSGPSAFFGYPLVQSNGWIATSSQDLENVYVFECTNGATSCHQVGNTITKPDSITSANGNSVFFGYMLAIDMESDRAMLVAGACLANDEQGAAYIYKWTASGSSVRTGQWTLMAALQPFASSTKARFGAGVAVKAGTLAVAAVNQNGQGALYIYYVSASGTVSDVIQVITCADTSCAKSNFGNNAIGLSGSATFLAVGARYAYGGYVISGNNLVRLGTGGVYIYSTAPTFAPTSKPTNPTPSPTISRTIAPTFPPVATSPPIATPTASPSPKATSTSSPSPIATASPSSVSTAQRTSSPSALLTKTAQPSPTSTPSPSASTPRPPTSSQAPTLHNSSLHVITNPSFRPTPGALTNQPSAIHAIIQSVGGISMDNQQYLYYTIPIILVVVLMLCSVYIWCRRRLLPPADRIPKGGDLSPYEEWHAYHDAKKVGKGQQFMGKRARNSVAVLPKPLTAAMHRSIYLGSAAGIDISVAGIELSNPVQSTTTEAEPAKNSISKYEIDELYRSSQGGLAVNNTVPFSASRARSPDQSLVDAIPPPLMTSQRQRDLDNIESTSERHSHVKRVEYNPLLNAAGRHPSAIVSEKKTAVGLVAGDVALNPLVRTVQRSSTVPADDVTAATGSTGTQSKVTRL